MQNRRMFWGSVMGSLKRSTMAVVDNIVLYTWKLLGGPILCFVFYCHNFLKKRIYCANITNAQRLYKTLCHSIFKSQSVTFVSKLCKNLPMIYYLVSMSFLLFIPVPIPVNTRTSKQTRFQREKARRIPPGASPPPASPKV